MEVILDRHKRKERTPACNSTYKKLAVQWLNEALYFVSSSLQIDSFVLRNRHLRQARNRSASICATALRESKSADQNPLKSPPKKTPAPPFLPNE